MKDTPKKCELCLREMSRLTKHHLIPQSRHHNKKNKKNFSRDEVVTRILYICRPCHNNIHQHLTNKELEYDYNTREKLLAHPEVAKFTDWVKGKPAGLKISFNRKHKKG